MTKMEYKQIMTYMLAIIIMMTVMGTAGLVIMVAGFIYKSLLAVILGIAMFALGYSMIHCEIKSVFTYVDHNKHMEDD